MIEFSIIAVFLTGIASFFLPCTLPIIIGSIGLLKGNSSHRFSRFNKTLLFIIGFSIIFIIFGGFAGLLGGTFSKGSLFINSSVIPVLKKVAGILLIFFGITIISPSKIFSIIGMKSGGFFIPKWLNVNSNTGAFLLGVIFASGWSACISPVLGGLLILAADSSTVVYGMIMLGVFSLGLLLPLLFISLFFDFTQKARFIEIVTRWSAFFAGIVFVFMGFVFLFGQEYLLSSFLYKIPLLYR